MLRATAATVVGTVGLLWLGGCTNAPALPLVNSSRSSAGASKVELPTYVPATNAPKPDVSGTTEGAQPGFYSYPTDNRKSVLNPPGKGGDVTIMAYNVQAPLVPAAENPQRQEMNRQLGVNLVMQEVPFADYLNRLALIIAGNDLPDAFYIPTTNNIPQFNDFLSAKCVDLSEVLGGDAVKEYPNLAALPPSAWRGMTFNNRIYGVPSPYALSLYNLWVHAEVLDSTGGKMPGNADDFKRILVQINEDGKGNLFGMTAPSNSAFQFRYGTHPSMFGAPNNWSLDSSGKLTRTFETEAYKASVGWARDVFAAGGYSPDSNVSDSAKTKNDFTARKMAFYTDGWSSATQYWDAALKQTPPGKLDIVPPFAADGKSKPVYWYGPGNFGFVVLKKASVERVKEVLGVIDYFVAPFGTAEHLLINYGVKDVHYQLDDTGNPRLTDQGKAQMNSIWLRFNRPPSVLFNPNSREFTNLQADEKTELAAGMSDPTVGLSSTTDGNKGNVLDNTFWDGITDIVAGRRPFSDYDGLVSTWKSAGGDQIRSEYLAAIAAAGS
jgi:putative aldouronate transport system substrate-binding protein